MGDDEPRHYCVVMQLLFFKIVCAPIFFRLTPAETIFLYLMDENIMSLPANLLYEIERVAKIRLVSTLISCCVIQQVLSVSVTSHE